MAALACGFDTNIGALNLATLHRKSLRLSKGQRLYFWTLEDVLMLMRIESDFRNLRV